MRINKIKILRRRCLHFGHTVVLFKSGSVVGKKEYVIIKKGKKWKAMLILKLDTKL